MPEKKKFMADEELQEIRKKTEKALQHISEMHDRSVKRWEESDKIVAAIRQETEEIRKKGEAESVLRRAEIEEAHKRAKAQAEITDRKIAELTETSKNHGKQIGGLGNKFGSFTESLAEPSLRRILEKNLEADYQGWLLCGRSRGSKDLEVDAWATARNGSGAAYLVEVKSRFKPKHINQVFRTVEKFREYRPEYRNKDVYPMLAVVEISAGHRELVWGSGITLIDIADGVFKLAEQPEGFTAIGHHGTNSVRRAVPHLQLVRHNDSGRRIAP